MEYMEKSIGLYFKGEGSDKEYHAQLKKVGDGFVVNFQYGARGSALKSGAKTADPVPYEKALKIFDKLTAEKTSKGYTPAESGLAFQDTLRGASFTGIVPQLLNPIESCDQYIEDDAWFAQQKYDGERRLLSVEVKDGQTTVTGINKKGLAVALPMELVNASESVQCSFVLDGEMIGDRIYAFDLLNVDGDDLSGHTAIARYRRLTQLIANSQSKGQIVVAPTAESTEEKRALLQALKDRNEEGIVFKKADSKYTPGRPNSMGDQLKLKFWKSATVLAGERSEDKRSVLMYVVNESGCQIEVGKVTIPTNKEVPEEGKFMEVKYLYAFEGGSLFQSEYLHQRSDVDISDCTISQLIYKKKQ